MSNAKSTGSPIWKSVPLSELVECLDGQRIPVKREDRENIVGKYPYYGASGIIDYVNDYIFEGDFILLGEDGENVVSRNLPLAFKISGRTWVNNHAHVFKPKPGYDIDFLVYILENRDYTDIVSGSAQPKLNQQNLMKLMFEVPEKKIQRQIAFILSTCDAVIEKTQASIAKYNAIKQGMLHDLFTRGIDLKTGKLRPKYADAPELYKESKLGWIPREWDVDEIGNRIDSYSGGTPSRSREDYFNGDIPWITSSEVNQDQIRFTKEHITQEALENSSAKWVQNGSVLVAMYGATAGQISRLRINATTNQAVLACLDSETIKSDFLYYLLVFFRDKILYKAQGSGQPNLSKQIIDSLEIPIISLLEQKLIANKLTAIDDKLQLEKKYLHKLQQIKAGLMNDLLSGKKKVKLIEDLKVEKAL